MLGLEPNTKPNGASITAQPHRILRLGRNNVSIGFLSIHYFVCEIAANIRRTF